MDKIMIGDIVKINSKEISEYPTYIDWFNFYHVDSEKFEPKLPSLHEHIDAYDEDYIVEWVAPHLRVDEILYAIKGIDTGRVFLVGRQTIKGYYHTEKSSDWCYDMNERLLALEVSRLQIENNALREDNLKLIRDNLELMEGSIKLMEENNKLKENSKISNPMPPLENGWFGLSKKYDFDGNCIAEHCFVVILKEKEFVLVYEDGGHDIYRNKKDVLLCYDANGICKADEGEVLGEIVFLCDACNFFHAKRLYEEKNKYNEIWRK